MLYGPHTEAFRFVKGAIESSQAIQDQVGSIERVNINPIGGYSDKFAGSDHFVHMAVDVKGTRGQVTVDVFATKTDDLWLIRQATINGRPIDLTANQ